MLKRSRLLHLLTNTLPLGNMTWIRGRGNRFRGRLSPLRFCSRITIKGDRNTLALSDGMLSRSRIYIRGSGNRLTVESDFTIRRSVIWITGDNNTITLGSRTRVFRADLGAEHAGSELRLMEGAQIGGFVELGLGENQTLLSRAYASEGCRVEIGRECAISDGVSIRTSDAHAIYGEDGARINRARDVIIGDGVWVCSGATLLKGARIGEGSILGGGSMLTGDFGDCPHTLLAGSPAKPIRKNIRWDFTLHERQGGAENI